MQRTDDDLLSRYLDGELDTGDARELEGRLKQDARLLRRLDAMRAADDATRTLFSAVDDAPMPDAVLRLLQRDSARRENVVSFPTKRGLGRFLQWPVAVAASVALAVGFLVSELYRQAPGVSAGIAAVSARNVDPQSGLHRMLEGRVSGEVAALGRNERGQVLLTFADDRGRFCRQLRVDSATSSAHGLACRQDGGWRLETLAYTDAVPDGQYQAASATTPASVSAAVDSLMGTADPLERDQEKAIISNSWKKSN